MLADVVRPITPVRPTDTGDILYERFRDEPQTNVIPVTDARERVVGLVERNAFFIQMGGAYGRALYARRPVTLLMDADPIRASAGESLATFMSDAFGAALDLTRGFVAETEGRYVGVGSVMDLLAAMNADNLSRAEEMSRLARRQEEAAEAAEAAHTWLREAVGAMTQGVALFDAEDRLVLWNAAYASTHAQTFKAFRRGVTFTDLVTQAVAAGYADAAEDGRAEWLAARLECHQASAGTMELRLGDGRFITIADRLLPNGGRVVMTVDVTDLKAREESFRLLFDANPVPMLVIERETLKIMRVNDAAVRDFGRPPEAYRGFSILDFVGAAERPQAEARLRNGEFNSGNAYHVPDGRGAVREVHPYVSPLVFDERACLLMAVIDVTERRAAMEGLAQARDAAEAANRAKSEFLANMSHEIRTPLNGVVGVAGALARTRLDERQTELVRLISDSAETLEVLLSDILDIARVEAGRLELVPSGFDPLELTADLAELFRAKGEDKGLQFEVRRPSTAPWVVGDKVRLKQVLGNLLSNAVKFTETGRVDLTLEVEHGNEAARLRWTVRDTGVGFDEAFKARMFGRFEQADGSVTRRFGGSGLGLSISHQLTSLMGGRLEAQSAPGEGAVFTLEIDLPVRIPSAAPESQIEAEAGELSSLSILLAEDHPVNRRVIELMFDGLDVRLTAVENGRLAVDQARSHRFDLILMDMQMPVMDGVAATRELRAMGLKVPIVMLSANALPEHLALGRAAGVDDYLTKPVQAADLFAAIDRLLPSASAEGAAEVEAA